MFAGHVEHFADQCGGVPAWLDGLTYYTAFTEGWGLYSENPLLSDDTDTYKDNILQKYGMVKWQVCINIKAVTMMRMGRRRLWPWPNRRKFSTCVALRLTRTYADLR